MSADPKQHIGYLVKMRNASGGWDHFGPFNTRAAAGVWAEETYRDDLGNSWKLAPLYLVNAASSTGVDA